MATVNSSSRLCRSPVSKVAVVREELAGQGRALGEILEVAAELGVDTSGNAALGDALATLRRTASWSINARQVVPNGLAVPAASSP